MIQTPGLPRLRPMATALAMFAAGTGQAMAQAGAAEIVELLCGRTVHYHSPGIGNQIEFTDPNGSAYLWHPLPGGLVTGIWWLDAPQDGETQVCYTYPEDAFGPGSGGDHCFTYGDLVEHVPLDGIRDGDPYDLASGKEPFPLPAFPPIPPAALAQTFPAIERGPGCAAYVS